MDDRAQKIDNELARILSVELQIYHINRLKNGNILVRIGDEDIEANNIVEALQLLQSGLKELRELSWQKWKELQRITHKLLLSDTYNEPSLENEFFLFNIKKAYELAKRFSNLDRIKILIHSIFYRDIGSLSTDLISRFNNKYLEIRCLHRLIMRELYRINLLRKYAKMKKFASISGPWANLDLPAAERMWPYEEDEEYFSNRRDDRRAQTRYNPEYDVNGYYLVWQDYRRDPYRFDDMDTESPYPSRNMMVIP